MVSARPQTAKTGERREKIFLSFLFTGGKRNERKRNQLSSCSSFAFLARKAKLEQEESWFRFLSFLFPPVNRKERNIFSLRSPVLAVWGRADTIQIPAFCGAFGWHPRRNERHSHPSDAPGGYSRILYLRTASRTAVKQKKKLNYSKIINHPKDVFPLTRLGKFRKSENQVTFSGQ